MHTGSETKNLRASPDWHAPDESAHVLELVRRFGSGVTSFQVLEPGYRYFFPDSEACVAYIDTGRAWVAAGAPLAAEARFAGYRRHSSTPRGRRIGGPASSRRRLASSVGSRCDRF